jgi:hypothetical protein
MPRGPVSELDADPLSLTTDCLSKIVELVFDDVVDCIPRGVNIIANLLCDVIHRNAIDEIASPVNRVANAFCCAWASPARSAHCALTGPSGAFESGVSCDAGTLTGCTQQWTKRTLA